ncbi:MAG: DMT family protein [Planctomycetia bacterium]|nr:DMT family protein [Planctomycetia bacterium]
MNKIIITIILLILSNSFMTFAWYGHLKNMSHSFWLWAALISWGIAFFEYCLQVPANRIGATELSVPQLKILQEVIAMLIFVPFALLYLKQPLSWNYLWAACCIIGAVFFIFQG